MKNRKIAIMFLLFVLCSFSAAQLVQAQQNHVYVIRVEGTIDAGISNFVTRAINIAEIVGGYPRWADDWGGNIEAHIQATVTAYPTVSTLLAELKANITEVVALASALPKTFLERKSDYFNTAYTMINIQNHILSHIDQIDANISAARNQ